MLRFISLFLLLAVLEGEVLIAVVQVSRVLLLFRPSTMYWLVSFSAVPSQRAAVIRNGGIYFAFKSSSGDSLVMATSKDGAAWSSW